MLIPMLHDLDRARHGTIMRSAAALVEASKLRPLIDPGRFHLDAVGHAHRRLEASDAIGKVVIDIP